MNRIKLTADQRKLFEQAIARVQESLQRRNWPLLPVHLYDMHGGYGHVTHSSNR